VERGVNLRDGISPAIIDGASYPFSDRLTLGPGVGIVGQPEDDTSYFPVVLIKWKMTDRLSLETGDGWAGAFIAI
jgi:hypothetical protein